VVDVHSELDAVNAGGPAQIVDEFNAGCIVDVGAVGATEVFDDPVFFAGVSSACRRETVLSVSGS